MERKKRERGERETDRLTEKGGGNTHTHTHKVEGKEGKQRGGERERKAERDKLKEREGRTGMHTYACTHRLGGCTFKTIFLSSLHPSNASLPVHLTLFSSLGELSLFSVETLHMDCLLSGQRVHLTATCPPYLAPLPP